MQIINSFFNLFSLRERKLFKHKGLRLCAEKHYFSSSG
ncbi:hypothetical protein PTRA_b0558 [Pseudoalteromonas translucida KMM 520]|uniref:Uncharacterized protein n=1 Tax=Pseudoalteromonas translucida KMM 520 TaxID=1315283 RepID=A0A0U2X4X1_9GAMM|nr:hypothetical protein PTRA_b0558 [Pseudoalteromonas translucida KMM 520]